MALRVRRNRGKGYQFRLHKPRWVDPYPAIPGTEPEKRLFEVLVRHHIYFIFQGNLPEFEKGLFVSATRPFFKPDFIIPEYRVILDPFSPFHHTLPDALRRDAIKFATYTAKVPGMPRLFDYAYYFPWAIAPGVFVLDQRGLPEVTKGGAEDVIAAIPELKRPKVPWVKLTKEQEKDKRERGYTLGPNLGLGASSVAAANRARARIKPSGLSAGTRRSKRSTKPL